MSERNKPKPHPDIFIPEHGTPHVVIKPIVHQLLPDEAVALGYALFEHGLYLKGKITNQNKEQHQ